MPFSSGDLVQWGGNCDDPLLPHIFIEWVNEKLAAQVFGITRTSTSNCVCHNQPQSRSTFRDEVSFREFSISGMCQKTQDNVFGQEEEE